MQHCDHIENLDSYWVYRFVRTDLPIEQHLIQIGHASWHAGMNFAFLNGATPGIPFNVTIGMPNIKALRRVEEKLKAAGIEYELFHDTDVSPDPTALVTFPIDAQERNKYFANYRLYSPCVPTYTGDAGFNAEGRATAAVAQPEHSVSNGGVEGANPSSGSMNCS